ncbi:DUF2764 family protein [Treponema parvum]|uniref:DUF2764 family protein n=1 Tax=Treponema parvum TaxID=138851 RepID=A0A975EZQ1_9SPIR|nr:DUF2764 family protein [Treponema parvum]QTQ11753.1 DUF2764 family protein [Treponema parvum]QTQ14092.1 DUF2764 family protein [Treponema parvum]QTQ16301.1 DUF2764 family protein [Treponema parvum]
MGNQYYLVAQLPDVVSAVDKQSLPITEEYFRELCSRFLDEKSLNILKALSLVPPRDEIKTGSAFVDAWYDKERALRLALAQVRALNMKKESVPLNGSCTGDVLQAARTAAGMDSPLSAEQYLYQYRMDVINQLSPLDTFSTDAVFAYGLKLMLIRRIKLFNEERGKASYHTIYDRILGENK